MQESSGAAAEHTLSIENKRRVVATGIEGVREFSPEKMTLTIAGGRITICGSGMKITAFSKQTGAFSATGSIISVKYSGGEGLKKRLLK